MTKQQAQHLERLRAKAKATAATGLVAGLEDPFNGWAMKWRQDKMYATDGERLWENPIIVEEIDVYTADVVTRRHYIRHLPKLNRARAIDQGWQVYTVKDLEAWADTPGQNCVAEIVIFDHTKTDGHGRATREVIRVT